MPDMEPLRPTDPRSLGGYRVVGRVGRGGQGIVFLGESAAGDRVAVKVLHTDVSGDAKARRSFAKELAATKRVDPFCTARVIDADVDGDVPYLISEFIDGPSLRSVVQGSGPYSGSALDRLAIGVATALVAIHRAGVVHRDLKPSNVLIGPDGPRVIDFGIAHARESGATTSGQAVGTPAFMAPEQVSGEPPGPAADVFAWACTIAYAANGRSPFGEDFIPAVINRVLHEEPDLGDLDGSLRDLVATCLDKDPANRPTAPAVLMRLLGHDEPPAVSNETAQILNEGSNLAAAVGAGDDTTDPVSPRSGPRGRLPAAIGIAAAMVVVAGTVAASVMWPTDTRGPGERGGAAASTPPGSTPGPTPTKTAPRQNTPPESSNAGITWFAGGLGLRLQKGWKVVSEGFDKYVFTEQSTGCRKADGAQECPGFLVVSPSGVAIASELGPYRLGHPYHPRTDIGTCPDDPGLVQQGTDDKPLQQIHPVGGRRAHFQQWNINCGKDSPGELDHSVTQREWYLPESRVLIVDWHNTFAIENLLSEARWR